MQQALDENAYANRADEQQQPHHRAAFDKQGWQHARYIRASTGTSKRKTYSSAAGPSIECPSPGLSLLARVKGTRASQPEKQKPAAAAWRAKLRVRKGALAMPLPTTMQQEIYLASYTSDPGSGTTGTWDN